MKIIHCSDIHLDSKMETNLSYQQAQERNNEICTTFSRMLTYAKTNGVAVILIAGDLFDSERVSAKTVDYILDAVSQVPEIDILYVRGNHDESRRAFVGRKLPKNWKTFGEEWRYYQYGNQYGNQYGTVTIAGVELHSHNYQSIYSSLSFPQTSGINIVMMHGQESTQSGEDMISLPDLRGKGIHYLALGHLHSYKKAKLDLTGEYCYCGCLEGRGFDECGEKGFVLLETFENDKSYKSVESLESFENQIPIPISIPIQSKFIPFASRTIYDVPVDITGLTTLAQISNAMEAKAFAQNISPQSLVKFTLIGSYTLDTQKDLRFLTQIFDSKFYYVKIKDESRLHIERESYEHDISLKGEFIRRVLASDMSEEEKEKVISYGIHALRGEEIVL